MSLGRVHRLIGALFLKSKAKNAREGKEDQMCQSVGFYQIRYTKELWNHEGHLTQLATLAVWNTKTGEHLQFCDFDAKSIYRKLDEIDKQSLRVVFLNNVCKDAGY